jgi:hypothetical protein
MFQPEAPVDGDDAAATAEGEPSSIKETTKGQTQDGSPQKDAKADVDAERAEV